MTETQVAMVRSASAEKSSIAADATVVSKSLQHLNERLQFWPKLNQPKDTSASGLVLHLSAKENVQRILSW